MILVSIICNTFNHEKYIRDALESFINQKTDFEYEVLIHDDASTDKTPEIIREYALRYPDLIKPIFEEENQYSKKVSINDIYQYPRVQGKYIAVCEGDDYWIDMNKLQKQVAGLEKHPQIDICAHAATAIDAKTKERISTISPRETETIISPEDVISGNGNFVATNSLLYRTALNDMIPPFRKQLNLDYTLQIHGSLRGGMLYLPDVMSVYRKDVPNSWSDRMKHNRIKRRDFHVRLYKMFKQLNMDTDRKYKSVIRKMRSIEIGKIILLTMGLEK